VAHGLAVRIKRRYGRNIEFIAVRPNSEFFRTIRETVMRAGRELEAVWGGGLKD
jgi:hypothetical protein